MKSLYCFLFMINIFYAFTFDDEDIYGTHKREYSLMKPYQSNNWDYRGSAMITSDYIRLTHNDRSLSGSMWCRLPNKAKFWEMQLFFKVHGVPSGLFGDGFAFWYVKEPMETGPVFGSRDYFTGLAVVADTYSNHNGPHKHEHPYISAIINNGTLHYDHDRDGTHTQLAGCTAKFRNKDHDTALLVSYRNDVLKVLINIDGTSEWKECFTVNGVILPTGYYFGVSAATGELSDTHDIHALHFYDFSVISDNQDDRANVNPSATFFEAPRDHVDDPRPSSLSTWKKIVLLIFGVLAVCGCVFIGGLFYSKQQEQKRKRFY